MTENLKLTEGVFTRVDGYFYTLSNINDTLFAKTDDGTNAFSYPLDTDIVNPVRCLQHDGRFFYTLECITSGNGQIFIKKWKIEDFVLKLVRTYTLTGSASQKFDSKCFSIENYKREFASTANPGVNVITLSNTNRLVPGDILHLGPSTFTGYEGLTEQVTVLSVSGNDVQLTTPLANGYNPTNVITFSNRCWLFNRFRPNDIEPVTGSGQLFSFELNPVNITLIARKASNEFREVVASTFLSDSYYQVGGRYFLTYMVQTNLLFIEVDPLNPNFLTVVGSAAQNNQETAGPIIPVHAITHEKDTLFRLQLKATFRTGETFNTVTWSTYNYQLSTIQRLPTSISLTADPAVISADGISTSDLTAIVRDQFNNAVPSRTVNFTHNDSGGSPTGAINPSSAITNAQGVATTEYRSGTIPRTVTITATT